MIHEATVTAYQTKPLIFFRAEDQKQLKINEPTKISVVLQRNRITFLKNEDDPLCKFYIDPYKIQIDNQQAIFHLVDSKEDEIKILKIQTLSSSLLDDLKKKIKEKKYRSCLSFQPNVSHHTSILSGESPTQKFRGFLNLGGIMFIILNLRNIIENFQRYGTQFNNAPRDFIPLSLLIILPLQIIIYPYISYSIEKLKFKQKLSVKIANILEITNICMVLITNIVYCRILDVIPVTGISFSMISVVLFMKLVSYYQVNNELLSIMNRLNKLGQNQFAQYLFSNHQISQANLKLIRANKDKNQKILSFSHLMYFLAAPTLCYQLSYPRNSSIRWFWLAKRIVECLFFFALILFVWFQYLHPELHAWFSIMQNGRYTYIEVFHRLLRLSIPNTIAWIAGFYTTFHLFLNISAQLLRFADRKFYEDWWNCKGLEQYWKLWNLPVHFYFLRHVYNPLLKMKFSKVQAGLVVFLISAVLHEFLVSVPLGIFGYYAFLSMILQLPAILIQKKVDKLFGLQNSELGNVSFWISFCILGQPLSIFIYYSLYMAKINNLEQMCAAEL